ncbi:hypothetical protein NVS89_06195 [Ancylobacter sp. MQZ15Z-1]|uniref:Uncharacterized protein n=1 Tax=Ancylobacter mangrovi TaxID=2972472 RepID=A0A9X2PHS3_9HYPH|nr:cytochrome c3 family protein [Ancylobacter mangrovi]MCS0494683.1 hypothetical protein [Ancylobacter mangrovi]
MIPRDELKAPLAAILVGALTALVLLLLPLAREPGIVTPAAADSAELAAGGIGALTPGAPAGFAGSAACAGCHAPEVKAWLSSQHAEAMSLATAETVRGDFDDARAGKEGASARFFRDGGRYEVEIEGKDGTPSRFTVTHTFGLYPLQQYLVTMPDGRLQALPFAYDTRPKSEGGQRWFHLYADDPPAPGDPLHWTGPQQNWNFMCAECHSTALRKNYDAATDTFHTTFSEISVGCESCHGAAEGHIAWARQAREKGTSDATTPNKGFASVAAVRLPADWTIDPATGSPAHGVSRPAGDVVETCARCHARRGVFSENWQPGQPLTDTHVPVLLGEGLFEADGQNLDEVFNDHAFKQSRMYAKGVTCTDCHDPHTAQLRAPGAQVCGQCHMPERFDTEAHTGHAPGPNAPDCIACHMPARTYMVIDRRHDHSFRIPRPDLSMTLGTPNTCNACHTDKPPSWAAAAIERWHGPERKGFQSWGPAFHDARAGAPEAREELIALAGTPSVPGIVRATAIGELERFPSVASDEAARRALSDPDPMVRVAALRAQAGLPLDQRWRRAGRLLDDPSPLVRLEAASLLADQAPATLDPADRARLEAAFRAYVEAQQLAADRPEGHGNLGLFLSRRGDLAGAEKELQQGLALHPLASTLRLNLSDLYRAQHREEEAERVLREGLALHEEADLHHALGLALVRQKRYDEALAELARASALAPDAPRYAYVYAVALQSRGEQAQAQRVVAGALARHPNDPGLISLALGRALRTRDIERARGLARRLAALQPDNADIARLAAQLEGR